MLVSAYSDIVLSTDVMYPVIIGIVFAIYYKIAPEYIKDIKIHIICMILIGLLTIYLYNKYEHRLGIRKSKNDYVFLPVSLLVLFALQSF